MRENSSSTILIIDNDESVVKAISTRLEHLGYNCMTATTGAQGLSEFSLGGIDLVITDLNMPVLDGIEFANKIRQTSDVPVIFVTGFQKDYTQELGGLQDITILRKPFNAESLIELVTTELALSSSRRAG